MRYSYRPNYGEERIVQDGFNAWHMKSQCLIHLVECLRMVVSEAQGTEMIYGDYLDCSFLRTSRLTSKST